MKPFAKKLGLKTPWPTETWTPIPHLSLVEMVEELLRAIGLKIGNQVHSLTCEGDRCFGSTEVRGPSDPEDYTWILGHRNSHDKCFPAGIVAA